MIPLQVRIKGMMRYREEQVADFTDGNLIAICGENGAGKSSIFDAIAFALYGRSLRVNTRLTEQLISEDQDYFSIEFDFEEGPDRFRVQRVRGGRATFGLSRWDHDSQTWLSVPGTNSATGLNAAIKRIIKLSDTAFRSSYLLGQDAATDFIDLDPGPRFQLIGSLIDLEEYERLARTATTHANAESTILRDRIQKLVEYEEITEEAVDRVREEAKRAHRGEETAAKEAAAARSRYEGALNFERLQGEIAALDTELERFDALISRRSEIEAGAVRFQQIEGQITAVANVQRELTAAAEAENALAVAQAEAESLRLGVFETAVADARAEAKVAAAAFGEAEAAHAEAARREREGHEFSLKAKAVINLRGRVASCEESIHSSEADLARLPALEAEAANLAALREAMYSLVAWQGALEQVEQLEARSPLQTQKRLTKQLQQAEQDLKTTNAAVEAASGRFDAARAEADQAAFQLQNLETHLKHRQDSALEQVCSHCGQPIDAAHAQEEIVELTSQIEGAHARCKIAGEARDSAQEELRGLQDAAAKTAGELQEIRNQLQVVLRDVQQLDACRADTTEKATAFSKVAPKRLAAEVKAEKGTATALAAVVSGHAGDSARLEQLNVELRELRPVQGQLTAFTSQLAQASKELAAAEMEVGDRKSEIESAAEEHEAARQALDESGQKLEHARAAQLKAAGTVEEAVAAHQAAAEEAQRLQVLAAEHRQTAAGHRRTATVLLQGFDADLRQRTLEAPEAVLDELRSEREVVADAPDQLAALQAGTREYGPIKGQRAAKQSECDRLPAEHRVPAEEAEAQMLALEEAADEAATRARQAASSATIFDERFVLKCQIEEEREIASERQRLFRMLAALLGKTGVQGVLVTDALTTITSHANSFLQRLTGGSLQLELARFEATDELEIKAIDTTSMRESRNIQTLSGSQKFRCAVALAFGIGQYTGAGGMRSIMIDEGFGGLDEPGQRQMIEELKHLATHMDKVIVISHLESFRDPDNFPSQIHITKNGDGSFISNRRH